MTTIKVKGNVKLKVLNGTYIVLVNGLNVFESQELDSAELMFNVHANSEILAI